MGERWVDRAKSKNMQIGTKKLFCFLVDELGNQRRYMWPGTVLRNTPEYCLTEIMGHVS